MSLDSARRRIFILAIAGAALAGLSACSEQPASTFKLTDITGAEYGTELSLPDQFGNERNLPEFRGKVVSLFFGFTQCPDVCPTNLSAMKQVMQLLGEEAARVQVIFVTIDPERDLPEVLKEYLESFDSAFLGLRGDTERTAAAAKEFRIFYRRVEGPTPTSYTMDHSAGTYLLDTEGRLRLYAAHGTDPALIAADIRLLLAGA